MFRCSKICLPCSKALKKLFVSSNGPKNRVGRSVIFLFSIIFGSKCLFYVDWELEGQRKLG